MSAPLESFYRKKSVLVTGHTGFKGGWLTAWLKLMGSDVTGYALAPQQGTKSFYAMAQIGKGIHSHISDIRDFDSLLRVFHKRNPEIIFHNAAQALVRASYADPMGTYHTNVLGTVHVLEAARQTKSVKAVVVVTSDKCYENKEWIWAYREQDVLGGHDPYSSSKACVELVTAAYRSSFFSGRGSSLIASARAGNVIGGGDWAEDRLVPDLMRGINSRSTVRIRRPHATRPWQHVLEPLRGYLLLAQRLAAGEAEFADAWNFGPPIDESVSVGEIAQRFASRCGALKLKLKRNNKGPHEARSLKLDSSKANMYLGWKTLLNIDDAIGLTLEWYRGAQNSSAAERLTRKQITEYMAQS